MRPTARNTIPIIPGAVDGEEHRGLSIGALSVDRCSKPDESLNQAELTGDYTPMKRVIAKGITRARQIRLPAQDLADLSRIPGNDRFLQHIEIGRVVEPSLHRTLEQ